MKRKAICALLAISMLLCGTSAVAANSGLVEPTAVAASSITIELVKMVVPQNKDAVSAAITASNTTNACFDYNASFKPHSNWANVDFTDSSSMGIDRLLRQAELKITVKTSGGSPVANTSVVVTTNLGNNAYIYKPSYTTNSAGQMTVYVEFRGTERVTVTAKCGTVSRDFLVIGTRSEYRNKFLITNYYLPYRSDFSTWEEFCGQVRLQGSGYDDTNDKYYMYSKGSPNGVKETSSRTPTSTGTIPTEYRTIAVDGRYIPRGKYQSSGVSTTKFHRARVYIPGMAAAAQDDGYRTAEDSGTQINGYHIDVYSGRKGIAGFSAEYKGKLSISNGYFFDSITYVSTLRDY